MWTPDAYQGAPSPVTGFMAAGSKLAAFAAMLRLFDVALFPLRGDWRPLVIAIAIATMIVGSVLAVVQEDVKRMLAYSSIAHAGFVLTGIVAANDRGVSGALFYLATYGITVLGAFAVVAVVGGRDEHSARLTDYKGLFYRAPAAGRSADPVPAVAGRRAADGRLRRQARRVRCGHRGRLLRGSSLSAALTSAIAAFFYLRVLVVMYMQESDEPIQLEGGRWSYGIIALAAAATLVLGLFWGPLIDVAEKATLYFAG